MRGKTSWPKRQSKLRRSGKRLATGSEISDLGGAHQLAVSSDSGKSQIASAGPRAPKKKKVKQKRHPGLPSQERQEYYKSYLAHL